MASLRQRLLQTLAGRWQSLGSWRDADADRFLRSVLPLIEGAQRTASSATAGYLSRSLSDLVGHHTPLSVNADEVTGKALRGVDPSDVYMRPFQQVWYQLSKGKTLEQAVDLGAQRLASLASTDVQLATTHTARSALSKQDHTGEIVGYRRILTGPYNCGMCIIASTQRYHKANLLPIHPACDCVVGVIVGKKDPGRTINSSILTQGALTNHQNKHGVDIYNSEDAIDVGNLLPAVHQAVRDTFGTHADNGTSIDYRKLIVVHEHGELGPVLSIKGDRFSKKQKASGDLSAKPRDRSR
jgi:hypothetical protein